MTELCTPSIGREDIRAPELMSGRTSIVLQRHEEYETNPMAENAGSITRIDAYDTDRAFFENLVGRESANSPRTMALFVAGDSRYGLKGYRGMETAELAMDAMIGVLRNHQKAPASRIVNLHASFCTNRYAPGDQDIRPLPALRERAVCESVQDVTRRIHGGLLNLVGYARLFHAHNPNHHLVIWAATHAGVISPLVRAITGGIVEERLPVNYGGGVVIDARHGNVDLQLTTRTRIVGFRLGNRATAS